MCPPIGEFVGRWIRGCSIDPFARNSKLCLYTNDINPGTKAEDHMDAVLYLEKLSTEGIKADVIVLDPPYSPRQISECYKELGLWVGQQDTQNGAFYKSVRDSVMQLLKPGSIVLSFGWNSSGMGRKRHFEIRELMLVAHGGAHNDTICLAEEYISPF